METCPHCKHSMLGQPAVCEGCGRLLRIDSSPEETLVIQNGELQMIPTPQKVWRSAEVGQDRTVELHIGEDTCVVSLKADDVLTLGRDDGSGAVNPDVDLMPYAALEKGVSRVHAALQLDGGMLMIKDIGSKNGTFVNGQRVFGHWRVVRHEDELRLGKLKMRLSLSAN